MIGFGKRVSYAFRCFFSIVSSGAVPTDIAPEIVKTPAQVEPVPDVVQTHTKAILPAEVESGREEASNDRALQMLALLQRDGRLIDFFNEDIAPYTDAQVGAAVRELHANCRRALEKYVRLEPIIASDEDRPVTIDEGFSPADIKLIGNVVGKPPFRGLLRHRGWRAVEVKLPQLPDEASRSVVAPAEVEIP